MSAADKETARNLVARGNDKLESGDFAGALEAFRGADAIMGVPTTGLGVGRSLILLGRLIEARDSLLRVTRIPANAAEPPPFVAARREAASLAAALAERIPSLTVELEGPPAGTPVTLSVDGRVVPRATTSLPRSLDPGEHVLIASANGFADERATVTLREGQRETLTLTLGRQTGGDASGGGSDAGSPYEAMIWIGFSAAGVGLISGVVTGGLALSAVADAEARCDASNVCPAADQEHADRAAELAHVSTASFVLTGVGGLVGLSGVLLSPSEPASVSLVPFAAGGVGATLIGTF